MFLIHDHEIGLTSTVSEFWVHVYIVFLFIYEHIYVNRPDAHT